VFSTLPTWDEQYNRISNKGKYKERCRKYMAKRIATPNAYPTRGKHNSRFNRLEKEATKQR